MPPLQRSLFRALLRSTRNMDTPQRMEVAHGHLSQCLPAGFVFNAHERPAQCLHRAFTTPEASDGTTASERLLQGFQAVKHLESLKHQIPVVAEWVKFYEHNQLAEERTALHGSVIVAAAVLGMRDQAVLGTDTVKTLTQEVEAEVDEIVRTAYSHLSLNNDAGAARMFLRDDGDGSRLDTNVSAIACPKERNERVSAVLAAIQDAMFKTLRYRVCHQFEGRTEPLVITDVVRSRRGCRLMLSFLYQAAARSMCVPLVFQHDRCHRRQGGPMVALCVDRTQVVGSEHPPILVVPDPTAHAAQDHFMAPLVAIDFTGLMAANMRYIVNELGSKAGELRVIFLTNMKLILLRDDNAPSALATPPLHTAVAPHGSTV